MMTNKLVLNTIEDNWLYQSNKFIEASFYLETNEQKMLRLVASMIRKNDSEFTEYNFSVSELIDILGSNKKNIYRDLEKTAESLMTRYIKIKNNEKNKWIMYHLIKTAKCENGIFSIKIDDDMKDFYLSLQSYTRYQLKNILRFKRTYSFRIYELLKQYEKIGYREFKIEDLKEILEITKNKYKLYGHFKNKVILKTQEEINCSGTDIFFDFEEITDGRKVVAIKFIIHSKENAISSGKIKNTDMDQETNLDILELSNIFQRTTGEKFPTSELTRLIDEKGFDFVKLYFDNIKKFIYSKNPVGFFITAIKEAYKIPSKKASLSNMSNFEQRSYSNEEFNNLFANGKTF